MKTDFLKKRAQEFARDAELAIKERRWNSAAFHLEQVCQLLLKHYLFLKWKDFPKTHSLRELLIELKRAYTKKKLPFQTASIFILNRFLPSQE